MFIGIDLGTSSLKSIIMSEDGTILAEASAAYPIRSPHSDWAEQSPQDWVDAAFKTIQVVLYQSEITPKNIKAISFSGQMHGLVAIDKNGLPIRPAIIWADQRSAHQVQQVYQTYSLAEFAQQTGNPIATGFMLASWLWMQQHEPGNCAKTQMILLPKDYLRFVMTGEIGTEPSDASATALYYPGNHSWNNELLERWNIPASILPSVSSSSKIAGTLNENSAKACGLPKGIPVIFGAGDQAAQAIGNGIIFPGMLSSTIGTGGQLFTPITSPAYDPQLRIHSFCHAIPNLWHFESAMLSAGLALKWLKENVLNNSFTFQELADAAAKIEPTAQNLLFLPDLAGNRTPHMDPHSTGIFHGLTLNHNYHHLTRALMEGVVMEMRQGFDIMTSLGAEITQVIASGGGTRHPLWLQLQADIFNRPIRRSQTREAAAVGAAILAAVGSETFQTIPEAVSHVVKIEDQITKPIESNVAIYQDWQQSFNQLYSAQKQVFSL